MNRHFRPFLRGASYETYAEDFSDRRCRVGHDNTIVRVVRSIIRANGSSTDRKHDVNDSAIFGGRTKGKPTILATANFASPNPAATDCRPLFWCTAQEESAQASIGGRKNSTASASLRLFSMYSRAAESPGTVNDQSQLDSLAMLVGYVSCASKFWLPIPRIDPNRIAVMGFSKGAVPAVYASNERFQKLYGSANVRIRSAHWAIHPMQCALLGETTRPLANPSECFMESRMTTCQSSPAERTSND